MSSTNSRRIDLQKISVDIARQLYSLRCFLSAIETLLNCDTLTSAEFRRHGRKIIALTEIARTTLTRAGLKLHLFTSCSSSLLPFKSVYFKLLLVLQRHRHEFSPELRARVGRLILPLSTQLVIQCRNDPFTQLGIERSLITISAETPPVSSQSPTAPLLSLQSSSAASRQFNAPALIMPPPDAFPAPSAPREDRGRSNHRKKSIYSIAATKSRPLHRQYPARDFQASDPSGTSGNNPGRIFSRTSRRIFGIFCTGKQSPQAGNRMR
ncbi:hypothetical protein BJ138DRAFT_944968 [Hygrophoropsis aurantiaca]|uniref:Uncharacterized protein n=1 Tax=Hygrophoropsis aurantiaca TaxID=72124 RepID=A0ACB8ADR3_9AGAM|nr:hypothetical protein BJ138DRAFT_944968 [Hygrophoropsis aurantiaca]